MKDLGIVICSILLITSIFLVHLSVPSPLFAPDGQNHYEYSRVPNCESGYANGICLMTQWLNLSGFGFWLVFFVISLLIPLLIVFYTKKLILFPLFFVFTGFFWNTMAMQVFAQVLMSLFFVFFVFEKNQTLRWVVLLVLFGLFFGGFKIHNTEFFILVAILVFELLVILDRLMSGLFEDLMLQKRLGKLVLGCGVLPSQSVSRVSGVTGSVRESMNNGVGSLFQTIFYYSYSFFVENMFIGFVVPGVYEIFRNRDLRKIYYFCCIVFGALFLWVFSGFSIWWVTRVLIWLPLVLFVPFMDWLQRQHHFTKSLFVFMGVGYFLFNAWYFVIRLQDMGCA